LGTTSTINPGCEDWHDASSSYWTNQSHPYLKRNAGSLFSYNATNNNSQYSRGVVVCGVGF